MLSFLDQLLLTPELWILIGLFFLISFFMCLATGIEKLLGRNR